VLIFGLRPVRSDKVFRRIDAAGAGWLILIGYGAGIRPQPRRQALAIPAMLPVIAIIPIEARWPARQASAGDYGCICWPPGMIQNWQDSG
jgi:hypothetical protein